MSSLEAGSVHHLPVLRQQRRGEGQAANLPDQSIVMRIRTVFLQPDQINMAVFFCHLVKHYLSSVRFCTPENLTSHVLQGAREIRSCIIGHLVSETMDQKKLDQRIRIPCSRMSKSMPESESI